MGDGDDVAAVRGEPRRQEAGATAEVGDAAAGRPCQRDEFSAQRARRELLADGAPPVGERVVRLPALLPPLVELGALRLGVGAADVAGEQRLDGGGEQQR
ncbi:MAG: hypothetical protein ACK6D1_00590, partial [Planctomycetota bacterium]